LYFDIASKRSLGANTPSWSVSKVSNICFHINMSLYIAYWVTYSLGSNSYDDILILEFILFIKFSFFIKCTVKEFKLVWNSILHSFSHTIFNFNLFDNFCSKWLL
jgi:hypothetical protein